MKNSISHVELSLIGVNGRQCTLMTEFIKALFSYSVVNIRLMTVVLFNALRFYCSTYNHMKELYHRLSRRPGRAGAQKAEQDPHASATSISVSIYPTASHR